ncbi:unnamed protein product, partial [Polarella glacialis]
EDSALKKQRPGHGNDFFRALVLGAATSESSEVASSSSSAVPARSEDPPTAEADADAAATPTGDSATEAASCTAPVVTGADEVQPAPKKKKGQIGAAKKQEERAANEESQLSLEACTKVCVANLAGWLDKSRIWSHFRKASGEVENVYLLRDWWTGASRGVAFVTLKDREDVKAALQLDGTDFGGNVIRVNVAVDKNATPTATPTGASGAAETGAAGAGQPESAVKGKSASSRGQGGGKGFGGGGSWGEEDSGGAGGGDGDWSAASTGYSRGKG